jgi:signal transduction histidine kinase
LLKLNQKGDDPNLPWVDAILRGTQLLQVRLEHLMATVRSGPAQPQPVALDSLVSEAVELFVKGLPPASRGIQVQVECEASVPCVQADPGRIIQVLIDLLTNAHQAISGAGKGSLIRLQTKSADDPDASWVTVRVIDDGPGIPEMHLTRVFEPFFTTKDEGTGFGLYLASEILKEQGGRLTASNNPNGGACFVIWLPRENEPGF